MSWQDKYRERYEERLRERWTVDGERTDQAKYLQPMMSKDEFLSAWDNAYGYFERTENTWEICGND